MDSNPALGLIGFWMMLQLAATIAILLGGIYALYCLGRASAGLDRMASAMEEWVTQQRAEQQRTASTPPAPLLPGETSSVTLAERIAQAPNANVSIPNASTPPANTRSTPPAGTPAPGEARPFTPAAPQDLSTSTPTSTAPISSSHEPTV